MGRKQWFINNSLRSADTVDTGIDAFVDTIDTGIDGFCRCRRYGIDVFCRYRIDDFVDTVDTSISYRRDKNDTVKFTKKLQRKAWRNQERIFVITFVTDLKACLAKGAQESTCKEYLWFEFSVDTRICIDAGIDGFVDTGIDRSKGLTNFRQ